MDHHLLITNELAQESDPMVTNETVSPMRANQSMKQIRLFFIIFVKLLWIMWGVILLYSQDLADTPYFFVHGIMFTSLCCIYCNIYLYKYDQNTPNNCYTIIYNLCVSLKTGFYCLFVFVFLFLSSDINSKNTEIFLWTYFILEYVFVFILVIFAWIVILCKCRIFYPILIIEIVNTIPIQIGATDNELDKLNYCKFMDGGLVCSNNGPLTNENYNEMNCIICQDDYQNSEDIIILPCHHHYHKKCGIDWLKINKTCPICRAPVCVEQMNV
ncbi:putative E3 ubiquitin-protein ligase At4g11680-like [Tupanvirus deep ocean]|uniref:E3 ubiquitin-protein ligase At4g11680-like n=2 Tax=Tupanvirus TaxID=2094720 RepID=A0AC62A7V6_9VIRU|nr:putative E3 ubiquitin-protein ligase At4g11680-like [Tupanvirus deep ocean]QKU33846.1 putative E3 ubiquitin-protein ligase At4g11680-like [Tupanvirus deep ocean]